MVRFTLSHGALRVVKTLDAPALPLDAVEPASDPCDARSWVQRFSDWIAPLEAGDLSALDMRDGLR